MRDFMRELGPLALASRLKRLSDKLMRDVSRHYEESGHSFQPRWFALSMLLRDSGAVGVTEAAETLGLTHPAINQIANQMEKAGLLESIRDRNDERRRMLRLSRDGRVTLDELAPLVETIRLETESLMNASSAGSFGDALALIEDELSRSSMFDRISARRARLGSEEIEIAPFQPSLAEHFSVLNRQWLELHFGIEEADRRLLDDPGSAIIEAGGTILFARLAGRLAGTGALLPRGEGVMELAKMAVDPVFRRRGVGRTLTRALVEAARQQGAHEVILATSPQLKPAVALYESLGFIRCEPPAGLAATYKRKTIYFSLKLR